MFECVDSFALLYLINQIEILGLIFALAFHNIIQINAHKHDVHHTDNGKRKTKPSFHLLSITLI